MQRFAWLAGLVLAALSLDALAAGVTITTPTGAFCWQNPTDADLAGNFWYVSTASGDMSRAVDAGLVTIPPVTCPVGSTGVLRAQSTAPNGQYYFGVDAYDTAGNRSSFVELPFVLAVPDTTPPGLPKSLLVQ